MAKKIIARMFFGFAIGVFLGQITQLIISLSLGKGDFIPVTDDFKMLFDTEIMAVLVQNLLTGLIGLVLALSSFIFVIDKWGLMKQYLTHFFITGLVWLPVVLILWMPHSTFGVIILLGNFVLAYVVTYWIQIASSKKDIQQINAVLQSRETGGI